MFISYMYLLLILHLQILKETIYWMFANLNIKEEGFY